MNAKTLLLNVKFIQQDIDRLKLQIEEIESIMQSPKAIRYDKESVQASAENALERNVIRLEELKDKINELKIQKAEAKVKVERMIEQLQNELEKEVLLMHYVDLYSFRFIADDMGYSIQHIYRVHGEALRNANRILKDA